SVQTNVDFDSVNRFNHTRIPRIPFPLSANHFLAQLCMAQENLYLSSKYTAEMAVNPADSFVLQAKIDDVLRKRMEHGKQISNFQDFVLSDGRAIREAINSGQKTFGDLLKLLEKANKFKAWLKNQKVDEDLCKNYLREVSASTWI